MNGQALRVWLIDDDASIRWVLERALRNGGMLPRAFDSAESALAALRADTPDVLITDVRMPGQSGIDLLQRVQASHAELPVIVMTAHADLGTAVSAYGSGAFEYLPKPFDIDHAVDLVRRAAQSRGGASADGAEHLLHRRRASEQAGHGRRCGAAVRAHALARLRGAPHQVDGVIDVEGLGQILEGAAPVGGHGGAEIGVRRHHDDRQVRVRGLHALEQVDPRLAGHAHVGDQHVGRVGAERGERGFRGVEGPGHHAVVPQGPFQHPADRGVVVDQPDP